MKLNFAKHAAVWKSLFVGTAFLGTLFIAFTPLLQAYSGTINLYLDIDTTVMEGGEGDDTLYYESKYDDIGKMYQDKVAYLVEEGREGCVLLKNDGVLPIKNTSSKITILGNDKFIYGSRVTTNANGLDMDVGLAQALKHEGYTVNTVNTADAPAADLSGSNVVFVVVSREGGEGKDIPLGTLALTDAEKAMIEKAKSSSAKVILFVSGEHAIEVDPYKDDARISAIMKMGNAGHRGSYGLAEVIKGEHSPSGKLVDVWATDSMASPAMQNYGDYSYTNAGKIIAPNATKYVIYQEGIYTDYKYYETRYEDYVLGRGNADGQAGKTEKVSYAGGWNYGEELTWSFGYGMSYTTFSKEIVGTPVRDEKAHTITMEVKVTNTGDVPEKEVVQIYAQSPYTAYDVENGVEKAAVNFMTFEKTKELAPGEAQTLALTVHEQWLASYDRNRAKTYIMDAGDYYLSVGGDAHEALNNILEEKCSDAQKTRMIGEGNADLVYRWTLDKPDNTTYSKSIYTGVEVTNRFEDANINYWIDDDITYLTRSDWEKTFPETIRLTASKNLLAAINDLDKYHNGKYCDNRDRVTATDTAYCTDANAPRLNVVKMRGKEFNDPAWKEYLDRLTIEEISNMVSIGNRDIQACESINFPACSGEDSPLGLQTNYVYSHFDRTTEKWVPIGSNYKVTDGITDDQLDMSIGQSPDMFGSEPLIAATMNKNLMNLRGYFFGEDCFYSGKIQMWSIGLNLHRAPYIGRASEYYAADPILSTICAAEQNLGILPTGHVFVAKHVSVNNQETNRNGIATFLDEQTYRENYLRTYEGAVAYGNLRGIMTAYNRLGAVSCAVEYDLVTGVCIREWGGDDCYYITDMAQPVKGLNEGNGMITAGISVVLNSGSYADTLGPDKLIEDPVLLAAAKESCHRLLYNMVNTAAMNGISENTVIRMATPWYINLAVTLDVVCGILAVVSGAAVVIGCVQKNKEDK